MRSRILAIVILFALVCLPVGIYFYFTTQKISKLTIISSSGATFSVQLVGSFGVNGLPLADRVLSYKQDCIEICTISPILPAGYTIFLTAKDKIKISDTIIVHPGETISKTYEFQNDIKFVPKGNISKDETLPVSLIENADSQGWGKFEIIGTDIKNRVWVTKKGISSTEIGLLSTDRFLSIRTIPLNIINASIDGTRSVLILQLEGDKNLLIATDFSDEREIGIIPDIIAIVPGDIWKIQTNTGTLELQGDRLLDDIRFTNSIDISPTIRIGYIDKKDTKKLSIANFPLTESVLVRLDRSTGESIVIRKDINIRILFFYENQPAYIDTSGNIYMIDTDYSK